MFTNSLRGSSMRYPIDVQGTIIAPSPANDPQAATCTRSCVTPVMQTPPDTVPASKPPLPTMLPFRPEP
jgi:hypothetical protein